MRPAVSAYSPRLPLHPLRSGVLALTLAVSFPTHATAQSDSGFTAWAASRAIPIDPAGHAFHSLDPALAPVRLIGVGESVHGMQEFTAFRFELLKFLVQHDRVTALILESGLPEAIAVDDYVRGRTDTVNYDSTLGPEFAQSAVIRGAIQWLRAWNSGPGRAHPVDAYGADVSIGDGRSMLPALDRLAPLVAGDARAVALIDSIRPIATRVSAPWWGGAVRNYNALPAESKERLTRLADHLVADAEHQSAGSAEQRAWAKLFALLVQEDEAMLRAGPMSPENPRDANMAANVRWLLDRLPRGARAMVWAHNAHVQRVYIKGPVVPTGSVPNMGYRLARDLGKEYFSIGTAYGGPSIDSAAAPLAGTVDAALAAAVHSSPAMLPLRGTPRGPLVDAWLERERPMRFEVGHLTLPLAAAFDAVVYFDRANPMIKAR